MQFNLKKGIKTSLAFVLLLGVFSMLPKSIQAAGDSTMEREWSHQYGSSSSDTLYAIIPTSDGGFASVGYTQGVVGMEGQIGGIDGLVSFLDADGNVITSHQYGSSETDILNSVTQTKDGGFIFAGYTNGQVGSTTYGQNDGWLLKTDANGVVQWSQQYGGASTDVLRSVQELPDGSFVACGYTSSILGSELPIGGMDAWLLHVNASGVKTSSKHYGTTGEDSFLAMELDGDSIVIAGYASGQIGATPALGGSDGWVLKMDLNDTIIWSKQYGTDKADAFWDLCKTTDGNYALAGDSYGQIGSQSITTDTTAHGWISKLDTDGNEIFSELYGVEAESYFYSIYANSDGSVSAAGLSRYNDPSSVDDLYGNNGFILKTTETSEVDWQHYYGTRATDIFNGIVENANGGYYAVGTVGAAVSGSTFLGSQDAWIIGMNYLNEINFVTNGGSTIAPSEVFSGSKLISPVAPTKAGYTFLGWYLDNITFQNAYDFDSIVSESFDLYASWDAIDYNAYFNSNGGSSVTTQVKNAGQLLSAPATPTKTGYTFVEWNTENDGSGTAWDFSLDTMPANDITLYAQWALTDYNAYFNSNGGSSVATQVKHVGQLITEPTNPTKNGYTFVEWNTANDGTGTAWSFTSDTMPANDVTLYAQWEAIDYNAYFDSNGGSNVATQVKHVGQFIITPTNPTKTGYTFVEWNTENDGSGTAWDFSLDAMPANDITLYAQWSAVDYNAYFNSNGGSSVVSQIKKLGELITMPTNPTKTGYTFVEWNTASDSIGSIWDFLSDTMPANDITLYAQWKAIDYNAYFDSNGGSSVDAQVKHIGQLITEPTIPTKTGYTFSGWNTASDGNGSEWNFASDSMPASDITLYAQWNIVDYNAYFNSNGGSSVDAQVKNLGQLITEPTAPTKDGYTFNGWNTASDGSGSHWDFTSDTMPANDLTLHAQWVAQESKTIDKKAATKTTVESSSVVATGDTSSANLFAMLMLLSAIAFLAITSRKVKQK